MALASVFDPLRAARVAWARRRAAARLQRKLEASSDRVLADMGIARADIAATVYVAFPATPVATTPHRWFVLQTDAA